MVLKTSDLKEMTIGYVDQSWIYAWIGDLRHRMPLSFLQMHGKAFSLSNWDWSEPHIVHHGLHTARNDHVLLYASCCMGIPWLRHGWTLNKVVHEHVAVTKLTKNFIVFGTDPTCDVHYCLIQRVCEKLTKLASKVIWLSLHLIPGAVSNFHGPMQSLLLPFHFVPVHPLWKDVFSVVGKRNSTYWFYEPTLLFLEVPIFKRLDRCS